MIDLDKAYENIVRYSGQMFNQLDKLNQRDYALALREVRAVVTDAYMKYGSKGTLTYSEMQKYNRIKKLDQMLKDAIVDNTNHVEQQTRRILSDTVKGSYERSAEIAYEATGVNIGKLSADSIQSILDRPVQGWSMTERLALRQKDMIIRIQGEVKRKLLQEQPIQDTWKGVKTVMEKVYVNQSQQLSDEAHRVSQEAIYESLANGKDAGLFPTKTWVTAGDDRVRPAHEALDGQTVDANDDFDVPSGEWKGYTTRAPCEFGEPALDYNCRCYIVAGWRELE